MRRPLRLASAAIIVTSVFITEAAALCVNESQRSALTMRVMQTELMVAALTCDKSERYNQFVRKFEAELISSGKDLRQFFVNAYGAQGQQKLDRFVTRLANEASQRSLKDRAEYCPSAEAIYSDAMQTARNYLWRLADKQSFSDSHGIPTCETKLVDEHKLKLSAR